MQYNSGNPGWDGNMEMTLGNGNNLVYFNAWQLTLAQDDSPGAPPSISAGGGTETTQQPGGTASPSTGAGGTAKPAQAPLPQWIIWLPLIFVLIFIFWSSSSSQKKEKRKRNEMLASINRHDKVQTIGGVIGSVVEVKDDEIVIKVDEANNIKMHFAKSAVQQVISESTNSV